MSEQKWFEKAHCDWIDSLSHRRVLDTEQTAFLAGFKARADFAAERERSIINIASRLNYMLSAIEFCVGTGEKTGKDTYACAVCGGEHMPGVGGEHKKWCELKAVLDDYKALATHEHNEGEL